ncbi:putative jnk/sapk-associated protein [Schistosoma mansoni]|nr:putative jnk/sapk-associated protein [Schistosoma mansoni]|eukprot:XP_018655187.1 putative jnk/sapk-associated protein [Schistosoma mansoni]
MDFGKEQRISPRVYQLAQIIYREFEVMKKVFGESAYGGLVPIVVGILEEMDLLTVDKQKLDLDLNLLTAEKNDISVQLCRQKELYIAAKRHIHCLEDELLGMKKETDKKFEELEENLRHYQLLVKNANDHIFRLEEREQDLRSELSAQNERYTKLLKIYVDYIETNNLSVSNNDVESGTVCVSCEKDTKSNEPVLKSTANSNSINDNPSQISVESGCILNSNSENHDISTVGIDLTQSGPGVNVFHSLDSSLKSNNRTASFIDIYDDIVDYETALESTPVMGTGDDVEEIGMIKEVEKLIKENTDLYETKNALNILKDDLIKKLDEVTGEKSMLIQEIHAMRTNRDEIKSEASRLSRLVYECRDQISSLTARLKMYEDVNEADQRPSRLPLTSIQQSKSCWTLNVEDTCHTSKYRNKSVDNLNDVSPLNDMTKTEDGCDSQSTLNKVPKFGEAFFTKREMARVIAERNSYKEKFLELQDALRLMERLRADHSSRLQVSTADGFERWVPRSFFSTVQSGLTGLFSTFDQAVPLASVLPSEAQCLSPYQLNDSNYSLSQGSHNISVQYMNASNNKRRKSVGLRNMFSRLFGYTVAHGPDSNIVNAGHDLAADVDSHSLGESVSKSLESNLD